MAQRGAMTRHDVGFSMLDVGTWGLRDNRPAPFGSAQDRLRSRPIYGVPPGLGIGDGLLLNAGCGVTAGEEPHPVKPLPAF